MDTAPEPALGIEVGTGKIVLVLTPAVLVRARPAVVMVPAVLPDDALAKPPLRTTWQML